MSEQIETIILNQEKEIHVEQSEQQRIDERTELNILCVMLHDKTEQCSKLDLEKTELLKKPNY